MQNRSQSISTRPRVSQTKAPLTRRPSRASSRPPTNMGSTVYKSTVAASQKKNESIKPTIKGGRPRRCMNCKKMIASEAYNQHFESCYRFSDKATPQVTLPKKVEATKPQPKKVQKLKEPEVRERNQSFRIKKVNTGTANSTQASHSNRPVLEEPETHIPRPFEPPVMQNMSEHNSESEDAVRNVEDIDEIRNLMREDSTELLAPPRPPAHRDPFVNVPTSTRPQNLPQPQQVAPRRWQRQQSLSSDSSSDSEYESVLPARQSNPPVPVPVPAPAATVAPPAPAPLPRPPTAANNPLIINTDQVTSLIERLSFLDENETIRVMIQQLRQLNIIAGQVNDIGQLGMHQEMGMAFANRIRQLQSTLINQIGEAILRSLSNHLSVEAAVIISLNFHQQPPPPQGFTEEEIDRLFPNKYQMSNQQKSCSICLNDLRKYQNMKVLLCQHQFHPSCVTEWLKLRTTCPVCRHQQKVPE